MIASAYRPLIFKVQSTVIAPELQIRADVYVRNLPTLPFVLSSTKYEKKYLGNNYFIFDFSNILQSFLSFDRNILVTPATTSPCPGSVVEYKVIFTEIYYSLGIPTAYSTVTSDQLKAVNSIPQHQDAQTLDDYKLPTSGSSSSGKDFGLDFSLDFK